MEPLLTREEFRRAVFERDGSTCVFCDKPAVDAHHILERRLWPDGGYYLSNGASVCEQHHMLCEMTLITVEECREQCGITKSILPPHLYNDQSYDKWGNINLSNGQRLRGELFFDESVQKVLKQGGVLGDFTDYVKYPRTHHLPWSPGITEDDRIMPNTKRFDGQRVVVTEKMDGENTTMYRDHIHARSVDSGGHLSRDWVKNFWSQIRFEIPERWRVCGENVFAKHSIGYSNLRSYFLGYSIWNEKNECLSWDDTLEWFELLNIIPTSILYDGIYNKQTIKELWEESMWEQVEGYVVRIANGFPLKDFRMCVGKFVRPYHVQTVKHWMHGQPVIQNKLR